jgi:hypothetical protein
MGSILAVYCPPVPEFDGPAGIAAAALLISVAAVLYDKIKK